MNFSTVSFFPFSVFFFFFLVFVFEIQSERAAPE